MKRVLLALLAVLGLAGCGAFGLVAGEPVAIVTTAPGEGGGMVGCYLMGPMARLVTDPTFGTALVLDGSSEPVPVAWPPGSEARRSGSEVEVRGPSGTVVRTGGRYEVAAPAGILGIDLPVGFEGAFADPACMTPR